MDFGRAFTFFTEDDEWLTKLGIAALLSLLSFLILPYFLLVGYMVAVTRQVRKGLDLPLPAWDRWEQYLRDGFFIWLAQLVYTIPLLLLLCIGGVATVGFGGLAEANESAAGAGLLATWGVIGCLTLLFAVALLFISPAIVIQYVREEELGALFRFGEVLAIARNNIGPILMATLALMGVGILTSVVLGVLSAIPCIGWLIGMLAGLLLAPWLTVATGHLYGQIAASSSYGKM